MTTALENTNTWEDVQVSLPQGSHVEWRINAASTSGIIRLDNFTITPTSTPPETSDRDVVDDDPLANNGALINTSRSVGVGSLGLLALLSILCMAGTKRYFTKTKLYS